MQKGKLLNTILAGLVFILVVLNIILGLGSQALQAEVAERQQFIGQSIQLETLSRQVITVLANMAVKTNDEQLKNLLASSGVNLAPTAEPATTGSK
jgi:hypothetical protein